jgi:uncharacterized membrane protein
MSRESVHYTAVATLILLIFLCVLWESVLSPIKPGGSLLTLKALPLLLPLFGILRGKVYTHQWTSLLVLAYLVEGVVRAWSDSGLTQLLAFAEIVFSALLFVSCVLFARMSRVPVQGVASSR